MSGLWGHYWVVAARTIKKYAFSSVLSILGLAAAFAISLLTGLLIWDHKTSDSHWDDAELIYQVERSALFNGTFKFQLDYTSVMSDDIQRLDPNIATYALAARDNVKVRTDNEWREEQARLVNDTFFSVFSPNVIQGSVSSLSGNPNAAIITQSLAQRYFGDENPIGKTIEISRFNGTKLHTITGVIEDLPETSTYAKIDIYSLINDESNVGKLHIKLKNDLDISDLEDRIVSHITQKFPLAAQYTDVEIGIKPVVGGAYNIFDVGQYSDRFSALNIATLLTIIIAVANYLAITTAIAANRGKDFALRKILGAKNSQLLRQYFAEASIIVSLAYLLGIDVAYLLTPILENSFGYSLEIFSDDHAPLLIFGWIFAIIVGFIATAYPVLILSRLSVSELLQRFQRGISSGGSKLRNIILFVQSLLGLALAYSAIMIVLQTSSMENSDKGFKDEGLMLVHSEQFTREKLAPLGEIAREYLKLPEIKALTSAGNAPFEKRGMSMLAVLHPETEEELPIIFFSINQDFFEKMEVPVLAGAVPAPRTTNSSAGGGLASRITVNEMTLKKFGFKSPADAVGKCIYSRPSRSQDGSSKPNRCYEIAAVTKDMIFSENKEPTMPLMFITRDYTSSTLFIWYETENLSALLSDMSEIWSKHYPLEPFDYAFMDDLIDQAYSGFRAMAYLLILTAAISIILTITNLYSMAHFVVSRRYREIAIRKVLGAENKNIFSLIITQLLKPMVSGGIVGLAIAYYYTQEWLSTFEMRIEQNISELLLFGILGISIFLLSVASQILRAIRIRPAETLHYE